VCGGQRTPSGTCRYAHRPGIAGRQGARAGAPNGVAHATSRGRSQALPPPAARQQWLQRPPPGFADRLAPTGRDTARAVASGSQQGQLDIPRPLAPPPRPCRAVEVGHGNQGLGRWSPPAPKPATMTRWLKPRLWPLAVRLPLCAHRIDQGDLGLGRAIRRASSWKTAPVPTIVSESAVGGSRSSCCKGQRPVESWEIQ